MNTKTKEGESVFAGLAVVAVGGLVLAWAISRVHGVSLITELGRALASMMA